MDRAAEYRSEYHDGQMFAMSGGSNEHSKIGGNLYAEFRSALRGSGCEPNNSDMRLRIPGTRSYVYPDLLIRCGENARTPGDIADSPVLIAEVLSPSTELFDRGAKFRKYRTIESLREYVLVSQDEPLVEAFSRQQDGSWRLAITRGLDSSIRIDSLGCEIPLAGVYENVAIPEPADDEPPVPSLP